MSKIQLPLVFISPNMKLSQYNTEHGKGINDAVLGKNDKFIRPNGKEIDVIVFSRVSPEKLNFPDGTKRLTESSIVRSFIEDSLKFLKSPQAKIDKVFSLINRIDEENTKNSDSDFISADGFNSLKDRKIFSITQEKLVRFLDSENTIINKLDKK